MVISKKIRSDVVVARPVFKDGPLPAFWEAVINNRTLPRKFSSASEVFRFVEQTRGRARNP